MLCRNVFSTQFNSFPFVVPTISKGLPPFSGLFRGMCDRPQLPVRKPRYDGRSKKRQWEERRTDKGEAFGVKRIKPEGFERIKRRKYALLLSYCGDDYYGMQRLFFHLFYSNSKLLAYTSLVRFHLFNNYASKLSIF